MDKLKHKISIFGSWNRRYFKVNKKTASLEYYNSKSQAESGSGEPSGKIHLNDISAVKQFDEFSFILDTGRSGTYHLKTSSHADMISWMRELGNYTRARQEYDKWSAVSRAFAATDVAVSK